MVLTNFLSFYCFYNIEHISVIYFIFLHKYPFLSSTPFYNKKMQLSIFYFFIILIKIPIIDKPNNTKIAIFKNDIKDDSFLTVLFSSF